MRNAIVVLLLLLGAALSSAACHTMRPISVDALGKLRPALIQVVRSDHPTVVVEDARVVDARLVGFVDGTYQAMPLADVKQVLMRAPARGRTAALIVATALTVGSVAALLSSTGNSQDPCALQSSECEGGTNVD